MEEKIFKFAFSFLLMATGASLVGIKTSPWVAIGVFLMMWANNLTNS